MSVGTQNTELLTDWNKRWSTGGTHQVITGERPTEKNRWRG